MRTQSRQNPGCVLLNRLLRKSSHKVVFASPLFSLPRVDQEAGQSARRCFCTRDQPLPSEVHRELHVHLCSFPSPVLEHLASLKQSLFCPFLVVCRKPKQNAEAKNRRANKGAVLLLAAPTTLWHVTLRAGRRPEEARHPAAPRLPARGAQLGQSRGSVQTRGSGLHSKVPSVRGLRVVVRRGTWRPDI